MDPRLIIRTNALAAALAFALYAVAVVVFAIYDSSDLGRPDGPGLSFELTYFTLYFYYFALYAAFVVALERAGSVAARLLVPVAAALAVGVIGAASFNLGFVLGLVLFFVTFLGLGGAVIAVPLTGVGVGFALNGLLALLAHRPHDDPTVRELRHRNIAVTGVCACVAAFFAVKLGMGNPLPLGRARVMLEIFAGLLGPLLQVMAAGAMLATRSPDQPHGIMWRSAWPALAGLAAVSMIGTAGAVVTAHRLKGASPWSMAHIASAFRSEGEVRQSREPAAGPSVRVGNYTVDRPPNALRDNYYDWKTQRFLGATFKLGILQTSDGPLEVTGDLHPGSQEGLAYVCETPVEAALAPCRVAERGDAQRRGPDVFRVQLYQGEAEIGNVERPFMMSCRYSAGICKIEFLAPWYDGLVVAVLFDKKRREHWAEVIRFAIPEIERIVHPAS